MLSQWQWVRAPCCKVWTDAPCLGICKRPHWPSPLQTNAPCLPTCLPAILTLIEHHPIFMIPYPWNSSRRVDFGLVTATSTLDGGILGNCLNGKRPASSPPGTRLLKYEPREAQEQTTNHIELRLTSMSSGGKRMCITTSVNYLYNTSRSGSTRKHK